MEHPDHPDEGYNGYMMMQAEYALYSTTLWTYSNDIGNYFIVPTTTTTTDTDHKSEEIKLKPGKDLLDTIGNIQTALFQLFEWNIDL